MLRAMVIVLALAIDFLWGDPPNRFHPVVAMGHWLSLGQRSAPPRDRFGFGMAWVLIGVGLFALPWLWLEQKRRRFIPVYALALKLILSYRNLRLAAREVSRALYMNDLPEARRLLSWHLVSRDTSQLSAAEVAGATIESLAENITDSVMTPLLAYAAGGLSAAWAYRFVNTADAMWGYRTEEFEQLGKFAARLDDVLNYVPARLTGWLLVGAAAMRGENYRRAAHTMLTQHNRTSSPNAGWTMSAIAGALAVTLTKRDVYVLEGGQNQLDATMIDRAVHMADTAVWLGMGLVMVLSLLQRRQ